MDVQPDKQNIDQLFSNTTYYIDFYQRQYKWGKEPVEQLLSDIFYKFNEEYKRNKDKNIEQSINKYSWYYLNTYVTNNVGGKLFVVDGQQRLTTLTLILIKLKHLAVRFESKLKGWIINKIVGLSGYKTDFWMNHEVHKNAMQGLLDGLEQIDISSGLTAENMDSNYAVISNRIDKELVEIQKFESFVFYFLHRLVLINLNVEQTDVPMIFEVINDRGVKLKPYEILKGKLLGQIDKDELDSLGLNDLWEKYVGCINNYKEDEIDQFFIYFLKAKFANTIGEGRKYDNDYHKTIFSDTQLSLEHNPTKVKDFLLKTFVYYTNLYSKVLSYSLNSVSNEFECVYYNKLMDRSTQHILILSACKLNDPQEDEKVKTIAYEIDRLFCLLQLQRSYDSNKFNETIYKISEAIRDGEVGEIRPAFNKFLFELLENARGMENIATSMSYGFFKETGIELDKKFKRYFFARIEKFIADNTNMLLKHSLYDLVQNTGTVNGFHIEHILADNEENLVLFNNDEEKFKSERNRLGGLLLLKGRDNISSNNETYEKKLESYANTLYWNETLRDDNYKSKLDFKNMTSKFQLNFRAMNKFGSNELEERHRLLYDMVAIIWE